jgi:hypothetical protein
MVEVYLQVDETNLLFLSIPNRDVQRLAIRPSKWLRFVMFCICGAHGKLHAMSDDSVVDDNSTTLSNDIYWYEPQGKVFFVRSLSQPQTPSLEEFIFVDYHGLNERITTSTLTLRRHNFRDEIVVRDGPFCVITGVDSGLCDAAHLIPKSKGNEVTFMIII